MAKTTKTDVVIRELFDEAVQGAFAQKTALMGSMLAAVGAVVIAGDMPEGQPGVGNKINIPYFGVIGDFEDVNTDGNPLTPKKLGQGQEQATVVHSGLAFEVSRWARSSVGSDIYEEGARQVLEAATRKMDALCIAQAVASGALTKDVYSATNPRKFDWDLVVDGRALWGDEQTDIAGLLVHSKVHADMLKLKDSVGRPLLVQSTNDDDFDRFNGLAVGVSDRVPLTVTMSAVSSSGTTPPTVTLSGTALGAWELVIDIITGGALATATFKFSTDGGNTWSAEIATGASVALTDTAVDSVVGVNGATGLTAAFGNATYNADNAYTSSATAKYTSMIVKKGAMAFWYNRDELKLLTDKDILSHTDIAALHLYSAPHRYKRLRGSSKSGIVLLKHN